MANRSLRPRRVAVVLGIACFMVVSAAIPALASGWTVTNGSLNTLEAGTDLGYDNIEGKGRMVRYDNGAKTIAQVKVSGLEIRKNYTAVVHTEPCATDPAGGAEYGGFSFTVRTDRDGAAESNGHLDGTAGPEARTIVLYDYADTSVAIACANLN